MTDERRKRAEARLLGEIAQASGSPFRQSNGYELSMAERIAASVDAMLAFADKEIREYASRAGTREDGLREAARIVRYHKNDSPATNVFYAAQILSLKCDFLADAIESALNAAPQAPCSPDPLQAGVASQPVGAAPSSQPSTAEATAVLSEQSAGQGGVAETAPARENEIPRAELSTWVERAQRDRIIWELQGRIEALTKELERYKRLECEAGGTLGDRLDEWERAEKAEAALAAVKRDAERYRWIRRNPICDKYYRADELDAAIDAMKEKK